MRIVVGVVAVIVALLVGDGAAHACKHKGKLLFTRTQEPVAGFEDSVPNAQLQVYATGAWSWVQEMPDGQEPASQGGCLSKVHLAELKRALARARFENGTPETCDAVADIAIEYASPKRKKKVRITRPCGDTADDATAALAACAEILIHRSKPKAKEVRAACRGTEP